MARAEKSLNTSLQGLQAEQATRHAGIEALRILGALGIIWYHCGAPGASVAYGGLIIFLLLSMYLAARSAPSTQSALRKRARRLLMPWLIWFLCYGALNLAMRRPLVPMENGVLAGVLGGSSIHLWYMPFIFFCLLAHDYLRAALPEWILAYASVALACLVLLTAGLWRPESMELGAPWAQYAHGAAAVLMGIFFGSQSHLPRMHALVSGIALALSMLTVIPVNGMGLPYLAGNIAFLALTTSNIRLPAELSLARLSRYTLGAYFVHILVLAVNRKLHFSTGIAEAVIVVLASFVFAIVAWRIAPKLARYCL